MVEIIESVTEFRELRKSLGESIGFVPTMGNLHAGHCSLLEQSAKENSVTVLSIFVNRPQFDEHKDFDTYPSTFKNDVKNAASADYIFLPKEEDIYPRGYQYKVSADCEVANIMEGQSRQGHFDGVLTVVMKLLMIVKPDRAYFGKKDYQQLELLKRMVEDFFLDAEIIACDTVREESGLALSSRNSKLSEEEKYHAGLFPKILHNTELAVEEVKEQLKSYDFLIDYIREYEGRRFGAVRVGDIRLIDNIKIKR